MATNNSIQIVLRADTGDLDRKVRNAATSVKALGASGKQAAAGLSAAQRGVQSVSQSLDRLRDAAIGIFAIDRIGQYAGSFITVADSMRNMDQRLLLVSKTTTDYAAAQKTVVDIARESYQSLEAVNPLYSRMALATANLQVSQEDLATVTKTVALSVALSGSSASESAAGLQQFAQAMGASRLGGDELRSVLENMPQLTKVFVDAAGGSMATLREMAEKGQLTTEWMVNAIKKAAPEIEKFAAAMPLTVSKSMQNMKSDAALYVDSLNTSTGFTLRLADAVSFLGKNMETVAKGGVALMGAGLTTMATKGMMALTASTPGVISSIVRLGTTTTTTAAAIAGVRAATTATSFSLGGLATGVAGLLTPLGWVTAGLGIGATAWALWGKSAKSAGQEAKEALEESERFLRLQKESADPELTLKEAKANMEAARAGVEAEKQRIALIRESEAEDARRGIDSYGYSDGKLKELQAALAARTKVYENYFAGRKIGLDKAAAFEMTADMSLADYKKQMLAETAKATADGLAKELIVIKERREAAVKDAQARFKDEAALKEAMAALNARYDAEANKAKADAAVKAERAVKKPKDQTAELKRQAEAQQRLSEEKLRAASQEKILGLELEKLEASKLPTALARAEAELAIDRRVMAERIELKRQEIAALKAMAGVDPAEIIRSESELSGMRVDAAKNDDSGLRSIASTRLTEVEDAWRRGTISVQEYQQAVKDALEAGAVYKEEADRCMILSGDNMTDALKLGFSDWAATVQSDAEFVANTTGQVINSLVSGFSNIVSSWEDGTRSAKDAMLDLARSTLQMVAQMIAQQLLYNAVKAAGSAFGFSSGGQVPAAAYATGGMVAGWSPSPKADNIPAWLTAREFVHPVAAVDYYGLSFMESIRRRAFPRNLAHALAGGTLPRVPSSHRLAEGGQVPGAPQQTTLKSGDTRLRVINVLDKNMVGDFLGTADGETAIINMIRRNGTTIRTLIGG